MHCIRIILRSTNSQEVPEGRMKKICVYFKPSDKTNLIFIWRYGNLKSKP